MKVRIKPTTCDAIIYNLWNREEIKDFVGSDGTVDEEIDSQDNVSLRVTLHAGAWRRLNPGDVIIRISDGIYKFVDADSFDKLYEVVDDGD